MRKIAQIEPILDKLSLTVQSRHHFWNTKLYGTSMKCKREDKSGYQFFVAMEPFDKGKLRCAIFLKAVLQITVLLSISYLSLDSRQNLMCLCRMAAFFEFLVWWYFLSWTSNFFAVGNTVWLHYAILPFVPTNLRPYGPFIASRQRGILIYQSRLQMPSSSFEGYIHLTPSRNFDNTSDPPEQFMSWRFSASAV